MILRSVTGGRVRIADATVDLGSGTEMLWNAHHRVADLRRGKVTVDVEHQVGQHLEVRTARFTVEVVGTRFTVDGAGVHTERGVVRVVRPDGSLAARVEAGGRWSVDEMPIPPAAAASARRPGGLPADRNGPGRARSGPGAPGTGREPPRRPARAGAR